MRTVIRLYLYCVVFVLMLMQLRLKSEELNPMSDVFLVDHMWTTDYKTSRQQLLALPQLTGNLVLQRQLRAIRSVI
jgi:hypothetical protein